MRVLCGPPRAFLPHVASVHATRHVAGAFMGTAIVDASVSSSFGLFSPSFSL